jgi:hypothetical protein
MDDHFIKAHVRMELIYKNLILLIRANGSNKGPSSASKSQRSRMRHEASFSVDSFPGVSDSRLAKRRG